MSPLEISIRRSQGQKAKRPKKFFYRFNVVAIIVLFLFLGYYAILVNSCTGQRYQLQTLRQKKEKLQEELRQQASILGQLKVPNYLRERVGDSMTEAYSITYLKQKNSEISFLRPSQQVSQN